MPANQIPTEPHDSSTDSEPNKQPSTQPANQPAESATPQPEDTILCAVCQTHNPANALACVQCGSLLVTDGATRRFERVVTTPPSGDRFVGKVIADQGTIILVFDSDQLKLPIAEAVTVGRINPGNDDVPDVDLTPYGAADQGVSRKHIKIIRKDVLFFVIDLGSTNGTDLNGKRLLPHTERMLRSDDELRLGRFKVKIKL